MPRIFDNKIIHNLCSPKANIAMAPGPWEIKTRDSWIKLHEVMSNDITIERKIANRVIKSPCVNNK